MGAELLTCNRRHRTRNVAMNSKRASYGIAKRTFLNLIAFREHFDSLGEPGLVRALRSLCQIVDVNPALSCKQW